METSHLPNPNGVVTEEWKLTNPTLLSFAQMTRSLYRLSCDVLKRIALETRPGFGHLWNYLFWVGFHWNGTIRNGYLMWFTVLSPKIDIICVQIFAANCCNFGVGGHRHVENPRRCNTSLVGQSVELSVPRSSVRFWQKLHESRTQIFMYLSCITPKQGY